MSFNCTKCGACCRAVNCKHLGADNLCTIYETRPLICRIDEGHKQVFAKIYTLDQWHKLNEQACKFLQENEQRELLRSQLETNH